MPSSNIQIIEDMVTQYINQYAVDAFNNQRLRTILLLICQEIVATQGTPNLNASTAPILVTSILFTDATNCPLTALNGLQLQIYWNDTNRFLIQGVDWTPLSGGGFTMLIPGFNSADQNYTFYVFS